MAGDIFNSADPESLLIRSTGLLSIPGATAGEVLTVQADKTIAADPGPFAPSRQVGQASYVGTAITGSPITPGIYYVTFAFGQGDAGLCTIADYGGHSAVFPAEDGTYAWMLQYTVTWATTLVSGNNSVLFSIDSDFFGVVLNPNIVAGGVGSAGATAGTVTGTFWADDGSPTQTSFVVGNAAGNEPSQIETNLWVQRLA